MAESAAARWALVTARVLRVAAAVKATKRRSQAGACGEGEAGNDYLGAVAAGEQ